MRLVYIGNQFYHKSGTSMSPIYEIHSNGSLTRSDWGKVDIALQKGQEVHIRPANVDEMLWAYKQLEEINSR